MPFYWPRSSWPLLMPGVKVSRRPVPSSTVDDGYSHETFTKIAFWIINWEINIYERFPCLGNQQISFLKRAKTPLKLIKQCTKIGVWINFPIFLYISFDIPEKKPAFYFLSQYSTVREFPQFSKKNFFIILTPWVALRNLQTPSFIWTRRKNIYRFLFWRRNGFL